MYESVQINDRLLSKIEARTYSFDRRDEWIEDAVRQYLQRDDLPERPDLDREEYRTQFVEDAIRAKLD